MYVRLYGRHYVYMYIYIYTVTQSQLFCAFQSAQIQRPRPYNTKLIIGELT